MLHIYRNTPVLESLFNKLQAWRPTIEKRLQQRCFAVNIAKFLRRTILKNIFEQLLLDEFKKVYFKKLFAYSVKVFTKD